MNDSCSNCILNQSQPVSGRSAKNPEPYRSVQRLPAHVLLQHLLPLLSSLDKQHLRAVDRATRQAIDSSVIRLLLSPPVCPGIPLDVTARFPNVSNIQLQDASDHAFSDEHIITVISKCRWQSITQVDLKACHLISVKALEAVAKAYPSLLALALPCSTTNLSLSALAPLTSLHTLTLGYSCHEVLFINDTGLDALTQLTSLWTLSLERCRGVTDAGCAVLTALRQLQRLNLSHTMVTSAGVCSLSACPALATLHLNSCRKLGNDALEAAAKLASLTRLTLAKTAFTNEGLEPLHSLRHLLSLDLGTHSTILDPGLVHVARISSLTHLCFGTLSITACPDLPALRSLEFGGIYPNHGVRFLFPLPRLTALVLRGFETATNQVLLRVATQHSLASVRLSGGYKLTDVGLMQLTRLTALRAMELCSCPLLTAEALEEVVAVNPGLTRLYVWQCSRLPHQVSMLRTQATSTAQHRTSG